MSNKNPRDIIIRPVVSEKSYAAFDENVYTFVVAGDANKIEIRHAIETIFDVRVTNVNTLEPQGQAQAQPPHRWLRHARRPRSGPSSPSPRATASRSSGADDAGPQAQAHQPRSPVPDRLRLRGDHPRQAREVAHQAQAAHRWSQLVRPHDVASPRWWPQAASTASSTSVANKDGVPAKVASIEYDPNRNARIALLHYLDGEKRYIIAPQRPRGRRHAAERPGLGDPARQRAAAALHPGRYRRCTTSS